MFGWITKERRTTERFYVSRSAELAVEIDRSGSTCPVRGLIVDLSEQGAKISLETSLQFSESVIARLAVPALDVLAAIKSKVIWARTMESGAWLVGCSFDEAMPSTILDRLAKGGFIERRRHARKQISLPAVARWELESTTTPVTLIDYSSGGFCLCCDLPKCVGSKVVVELADQSTILATVKWQSTDGTKYRHGCEFGQQSEVHSYADIIRRLCQQKVDDGKCRVLSRSLVSGSVLRRLGILTPSA
jgi:hypothetical protein